MDGEFVYFRQWGIKQIFNTYVIYLLEKVVNCKYCFVEDTKKEGASAHFHKPTVENKSSQFYS